MSLVRASLKDRRKGRTDWERVRNLSDDDILQAIKSDTDTVLMNREFWRTAVLVRPDPKASVSLRVDRDVLDFFKSKGRGYQTRINAVLRAYITHTRKKAG